MVGIYDINAKSRCFFSCQDCDTLQPHTLVTERGNRTEANKNEFTS